jgi:hypothetical protein
MAVHSLIKKNIEMEFNVRISGYWQKLKTTMLKKDEDTEELTTVPIMPSLALPWMQNVSYAHL